jgi:hypothetical protein
MCYSPIKILNKKTGIYESRSCRKCIECLQVRANEWALRGHFELKEHKENCFITLTYAKNPVILHKEHMQKFIKKLRKQIYPKKIKYFSCGEYGDRKLRPHYHIIIFGYDFKDKIYSHNSKSNIPIYISKQLTDIWGHGETTVQTANANTVRYSAKYSAKLKDHLPSNLQAYPEFNTMSQNLGVKPILKNIETYLKTDQIYIEGFSYKIPQTILIKYVNTDSKFTTYGERYNFIQEFKEKRFNQYSTYPELKVRERLAKKRVLHSSLRTL